MALPQHITYGEGGKISLHLRNMAVSGTVKIYDDGGSAILNAVSCDASATGTRLTANVSAGDTSFAVAANTGIGHGDELWLQDDPEAALVESVEGTNVVLKRPLLYNHINNANVVSTLASFSVNSVVANTLFWDGYCLWNIQHSGGNYHSYYTPLECTKYPMDCVCSIQDIMDLEPKFYDIIDSEADAERMISAAHEFILGRIAQKSPDLRVRVFVGSSTFRRATAIATLYLYYLRRPGEDARDLADNYKDLLDSDLSAMVAVTPRDADQDGKIEPDEKISMGTVRLVR